MSIVADAAALLALVAAFLAIGWVVDAFGAAIVGRDAAGRAALERDYEAHLIDEEALARGLTSLDEAA